MTTYVCSGCGIENRAISNLTGLKHTQTGKKPSKCNGSYRPKAVQP